MSVERRFVNECNSIIDEYLETEKIDQVRFNMLVVQFIRHQFTDTEIHESTLPIKGLFK